jgi:hypothetical protein
MRLLRGYADGVKISTSGLNSNELSDEESKGKLMVNEEGGMMLKKVVLYIWDTGLEFTVGAENRHRKPNFEKQDTMERYKILTSQKELRNN